MGDHTGIEWTDATWNPVVGCSVVSPGCTNCYAMRQAARIERMTPGSHYAGTTAASKAGPVWTGQVALAPDHILTAPLRWRRPRRIFVNSMGDLFHESVPDEWIDRVFAVMALAPQHTFQVLTKRSARMRAYMDGAIMRIADATMAMRKTPLAVAKGLGLNGTGPVPHLLAGSRWWPLPNVWLGVSTEDQPRADERVPDLLATPAAVRFVSAEPLLGRIFYRPRQEADDEVYTESWLHGTWQRIVFDGVSSAGNLPNRIDWVIVGGESGPGARPMHPDWARSIRDQCAAAGVPFFFKQWGEWSPHTAEIEDEDGFIQTTPRGGVNWLASRPGAIGGMFRVGKQRAGRLLDGRTHDAMPAAE